MQFWSWGIFSFVCLFVCFFPLDFDNIHVLQYALGVRKMFEGISEGEPAMLLTETIRHLQVDADHGNAHSIQSKMALTYTYSRQQVDVELSFKLSLSMSPSLALFLCLCPSVSLSLGETI